MRDLYPPHWPHHLAALAARAARWKLSSAVGGNASLPVTSFVTSLVTSPVQGGPGVQD